jgi:hypothetical protein
MAGSVRLVDPVGLGVEGAEVGDGVAHGGELVRSAGRAVSWIEEEGRPALAAERG